MDSKKLFRRTTIIKTLSDLSHLNSWTKTQSRDT